MNLSEMVDKAAEKLPDSPALVFEDQTVTYSELLSAVNRLSGALIKAGVRKGDCVVTLLGNRPEFVVGYFAIVRIGAIAVTLNPVSTVFELGHYFADCKPKAKCLGNVESRR